MWYHLVGTSHIAATARKQITDALKDFDATTVAVELDRQRLSGLLSGGKPSYSPRLITKIGVRGYLFAVIGGYVQRKLGKVVNVAPGVDMLAAVRIAQRENKRLVLIDRNIQVTLHHLNKALGWAEAKQFLKDTYAGLRGEKISIPLTKTPSPTLVKKLLNQLRQRYPRVYHVLVEERNQHMVAALKKYHEQYPEEKILVVVGAGHIDGMQELLQESI